MLRLNTIRTTVSYLILFPAILISVGVTGVQAQDSAPLPEQSPESQPNQPNMVAPPPSILSLQGGQQLIEEADRAIDAQQYDVAASKLQNARQVFNQLSNFYLQLFNSFSGLDNRIAESQRKKALETGQLRDDATYKLALVHRAQNKSELSVPLLIQIISSQSPTSGLGKKAYQQLSEIGFVDEPLSAPDPAPQGTGETSEPAPTPAPAE